MKIGRNDPCPCGSGKKYKKCCMNKTVTPTETLQYRRLSKVLDKLMPRLINYGLSVFGEKGANSAMTEFLGWPDPDDIPDEAAIDRAGMLFWPWFVFNWEYYPLEDEEDVLDGPEETTIAELFLKTKRIDLQSLEGKLILAANRNPYSFLEILAVRPGQSVQARDILTGIEMDIQESLGSEALETGDILFGGVIRVDDVGMFLGLSAFVLPPGIKPRLIALRRTLSRGRGKVTHDDLFEEDLEIRQLFWDMDRDLHRLPEMRNTDGDPMEFHKLIYDIDSSDLAAETLAFLCVTETVEEIREMAKKDQDGKIHRVDFDWNRIGNPVHKGMPNTVLGKIEIHGNRMTITLNSARRAETIQKEIRKRLGTAARLRLDEITDIDAMMKESDSDDVPFAENTPIAPPELQQHIGKMLRAHWEYWVDEKIPALGNKTPKQAVKTADGREAVEALLLDAEKTARRDPDRLTLEKEIIAKVRRRLKLDQPLSTKSGIPDSPERVEQIAQIKERIAEFGEMRLHDTYTGFALKLCDTIAGSDSLNIHRGRIDIWSAAIVYAIAHLNFLFSSETPNHLTPDELCNWFKVKTSTVGNKASAIRTALDLYYSDVRFCAPHVTRIFRFYEDKLGFIHHASELEPGADGMDEPIPLKPPAQTKEEKSKTPVKTDKPVKKIDDRQLSLFED